MYSVMKYKIITGFGNSREIVQIGADDWKISFDVRLDADTLYNIFDETGSTNIEVVLREEGTGIILLTYDYVGAYPETMNGNMDADSYFKGKLDYIIPYYNSTGSENRSVS